MALHLWPNVRLGAESEHCQRRAGPRDHPSGPQQPTSPDEDMLGHFGKPPGHGCAKTINVQKADPTEAKTKEAVAAERGPLIVKPTHRCLLLRTIIHGMWLLTHSGKIQGGLR
eukprot:2659111-Alexandrium_andersonii.AAC.1